MTAAERAADVRILCLGDSYTIGEGVAPDDRWAEQLTRLLRERGLRVGNPSIVARTGWATDELSDGIDAARLAGTFDLVTLLIGVNDQYRGRAVSDFRPRFVELLGRAIAFAGDRADHVLVLSIPDWGVTPFATDRDRRAIASMIDAFNDAVRSESNRAGSRLVDITPSTRNENAAAQVVADGLHPSATMYATWARLALPVALIALGTPEAVST